MIGNIFRDVSGRPLLAGLCFHDEAVSRHRLRTATARMLHRCAPQQSTRFAAVRRRHWSCCRTRTSTATLRRRNRRKVLAWIARVRPVSRHFPISDPYTSPAARRIGSAKAGSRSATSAPDTMSICIDARRAQSADAAMMRFFSPARDPAGSWPRDRPVRCI